MAMINFNDLSVGQVAGIIAAAIFIVQIIVPSIFPLILVGLLNENESTVTSSAATWSVVSRMLQSSHWPTILQSDSAGTSGVLTRVKIISWIAPITALILAVTAIVTPLGLYEVIIPSGNAEMQPFAYAPDTSGMGFGTAPRSSVGFNRFCASSPGFWACPGGSFNISSNQSSLTVTYGDDDTRIPHLLYDVLQSGLEFFNKSLSSIFDIEFRNYAYGNSSALWFKNTSSFLVSDYRQLSSFVLNDKIDIVEGLIVDTHDGGVGFRNHSIPKNTLTYGATWSEDILFIVPDTKCVDLNLTVRFALPDISGADTANGIPVLTDQGGFSNLDAKYVVFNATRDTPNNLQDNLDLRDRAYAAAWINNRLTAEFLNVTPDEPRQNGSFRYLDSFTGKLFPLIYTDIETNRSGTSTQTNRSNYYVNFKSLSSNDFYGNLVSGLILVSETSSTLSNSSLANTSLNTITRVPFYKNPFKITSTNFSDSSLRCQNQGGRDLANITNIGVVCGVINSVPRPIDYTSNVAPSFEPGALWSQSYYSCASAAKAIIKTVNFRYNGTSGLSALDIVSISDRKYNSEEEKPLWAVENVDEYLITYDPLWGITHPKYQTHPNISTVRKESLWLPGYSKSPGSPFSTAQNLPGANFYIHAFRAAYSIPSSGSRVADYSGQKSLPLYNKWFELSKDAGGSAHLVNLVWTDLVANGIVGTRGWASQSEPSNLAKRAASQDSGAILVPLYPYRRQVLFKYEYGVPAFIVCAIALLLALTAIILATMRRVSIRKMKKYVNLTSFGRGVVSLLYPESGSKELSAHEWKKNIEKKQIIVGSERPLAVKSELHRLKGDPAEQSLLQGKDTTNVTTTDM